MKLLLNLAIVLAITVFNSACAAPTSGLPAAQVDRPPVTTPAPNNYAQGDTWLCRPGRNDACTVDLDSTVVGADGSLTVEPYAASVEPKFDCFYVYPTVSYDPLGNSDMVANQEEIGVIKGQFARFGSVCRTYAPLYRQVTLTALRAGVRGKDIPTSRQLGYNDVLDAWNYYLQNDNDGRGVVLVGHSQGSGVLQRLIQNEIDGKVNQSKIISALLIGSRVAVPQGKTVGGAFGHMPLCTATTQTACIITFASFRNDLPPPVNTRFGQIAQAGMVAACTNPASLAGGSGILHDYTASGQSNVAAALTQSVEAWTSTGQRVQTPFVSLPGMLSSECKTGANGSYLAISVHADVNDKRVDDIVGDVVVEGAILQDWGLHLIDMSLAMGNLLDIVKQQSIAWLNAQ